MIHNDREIPAYPLWAETSREEERFTASVLHPTFTTVLDGMLYRIFIRTDNKGVLLLAKIIYLESFDAIKHHYYWRVMMELNCVELGVDAVVMLERLRTDLPSYLVLAAL